ncbi:MAG: hypothetical protein DMF66_09110 [Acidobacteria bacterium]|nr:MAG: hypothetical protein DMF66_09110 [Acidobacteriota bacterium]
MRDRNRHTLGALKATLAVALLLSLAAAAAAQTASTTYRGTARDPFTKYKRCSRPCPCRRYRRA